MRYVSVCLMTWLIIGCSNTSTDRVSQNDSDRHPIRPTDYSPTTHSRQPKVLLDVPIIKQNPELKYGCEVTSLAMILQYAGINVDKMELAAKIPKDMDPVVKDNSGDIIQWGDPNDGFVGDVTGKKAGYAVYAKPTEKLMRSYMNGRTINLTKKPFYQLIYQVRQSKPVLVWATGDFKAPDRWESWRHEKETIRTPLDLHAVVLVGFDERFVYVNDPLTGKKAAKIDKNTFINAWNALGKQALSYQ